MATRPTSVQTKFAAQRIGSQLTTWRKLLGLTAQQVSERAAISRTTLRRLEHGEVGVSYESFLNVCRALGVLDPVVTATDPYETDFGRARADQQLPQRVRS
ncbi:MAG: helix-turn-helix domain-containing protein [Propionibacteriaceae bacterium]|jgi:transcriptional regulator with XRE-family HTH domain|nr:helix-turn-helix domain-containing protein [Propionibacteriaceae bacterium]